MEFKLLALLAMFLIANESTQVTSLESTMAPPETYWNSMLPNTPIPQPIKHILELGKKNEEQSITMKVKLAETNDEEDSTLNFIEQDILPGNTMNLHLRNTTNDATFAPRKIADAMPFSLNKSVEEFYKLAGDEPNPDKLEANIIRKTIERCDELRISGNTDLQSCLNSLVSMMNFVTTRLGHDIQAINTEVKHGETRLRQNYTIESGVEKLQGSKFVACHKLNYPYAMFYCHVFKANEGFVVRVPLKGSNGAEVVAAGVCHSINKKEWASYLVNIPTRMADAKSGNVPLCHFLAGDSIVWTNKRST